MIFNVLICILISIRTVLTLSFWWVTFKQLLICFFLIHPMVTMLLDPDKKYIYITYNIIDESLPLNRRDDYGRYIGGTMDKFLVVVLSFWVCPCICGFVIQLPRGDPFDCVFGRVIYLLRKFSLRTIV